MTDAWSADSERWRDPVEVVSNWPDASAAADPRRLAARVHGAFWEELERLGVTLLVGREYEHLLLALAVVEGRPRVSYLVLPHPGGIAADAESVYVAATRNPNQVFTLRPVVADGQPLVPVASAFYPGRLYLHDLAMVGGHLHATATGTNTVISLSGAEFEARWWPRSVEGPDGRERNTIQLNSIAAGATLEDSYFTASAASPGRRVPGQRSFPVDRRGVLFSGRTREVEAGGFTRPHSARWYRGAVWVADSGYGRLCRVDGGAVESVAELGGWTRGLAFAGDTAILATSRVIPRFAAYAPGLDVDRSRCGVHLIDTASGAVRGSLIWPHGNQVFAVEPVPNTFSLGFPFLAGRSAPARTRALFYGFRTSTHPEWSENS